MVKIILIFLSFTNIDFYNDNFQQEWEIRIIQ